MDLFSAQFFSALLAIVIIDLVLAWTAAKMMMSEPLIKDYFVDQVALSLTVYAVVIGGVLGAGMLVNRRHMGQHADAHVVDLAAKSAAVSDAGT